MKTFTNADIRKFEPCYDPIVYLKDEEDHTIIAILENEAIPFEDRLWVILRTDFISERLTRLFAVWSYRQTLQWIKNPDPRSIECANVSERYAEGSASIEELSAAESAAWSAAESAARSAAWSAEWAARSAARSAASAAWAAQKDKLKEMILAGVGTGDTK